MPEFRKFDIKTSIFALENKKSAENSRLNPESE
jgi:hypothetical protein